MSDTKKTQLIKRSMLPKCKKKILMDNSKQNCNNLFKTIISGNFKVDDDTIVLLNKCSQNDFENIMGKNI
tara:strand:- start:449 stop:658 length:210 start_codon:yes stop_codon:yes gene_type:complete